MPHPQFLNANQSELRSIRFRKELLPLAKELIEKRSEGGDEKFVHGAERVDIFHEENVRFRCKVRRFEFLIDEPPERGGTDQGPNPLAYFLAGAGSCYITYFARLLMLNEVSVDELGATVLGRYDRKLDGSFTEILFEVRAEGKASAEQLVDIAKAAKRLCYAHNTLSKAAKVTVNLFLNGEKIFAL